MKHLMLQHLRGKQRFLLTESHSFCLKCVKRTCRVFAAEVHVNSGVWIKVCAMEPGSVRVTRLSKTHSSVLQAAWYRYWKREGRRGPEVSEVQTESSGDPLEITVR